jgi:hypothetical protein
LSVLLRRGNSPWGSKTPQISDMTQPVKNHQERNEERASPYWSEAAADGGHTAHGALGSSTDLLVVLGGCWMATKPCGNVPASQLRAILVRYLQTTSNFPAMSDMTARLLDRASLAAASRISPIDDAPISWKVNQRRNQRHSPPQQPEEQPKGKPLRWTFRGHRLLEADGANDQKFPPHLVSSF